MAGGALEAEEVEGASSGPSSGAGALLQGDGAELAEACFNSKKMEDEARRVVAHENGLEGAEAFNRKMEEARRVARENGFNSKMEEARRVAHEYGLPGILAPGGRPWKVMPITFSADNSSGEDGVDSVDFLKTLKDAVDFILISAGSTSGSAIRGK